MHNRKARLSVIEEKIRSLSAKHNYSYRAEYTRTHLLLYLSPAFIADIRIRCEISLSELSVTPVIYIRTSSWTYDGERTDLHDIISQLLTGYFRTISNKPMSLSLWDDPNEWSMIDAELYSRWIFIEQPNCIELPFNDSFIELLDSILYGIAAFSSLLREISIKAEHNMQSYEKKPIKKNYQLWAKKVAKVFQDDLKEGTNTYNQRINPSWNYYRSYKRGISVVQSPVFCKTIYIIFSEYIRKSIRIVGSVNGQIFHSGNSINNFISNDQKEEVLTTLKTLDNRIGSNVLLIPSENSIIAITSYYLGFFTRDTSKKAFEIEREHLRKRHIEETAVLFPDLNFEWQDKIDDNNFELFVKELLSRQENVKWARKVGHSRERDGGRDLIVEWHTLPLNNKEAKLNKGLHIKRKVLVQCKAVTRGLSKSDVSDIRDMIEYYNADGFFLATSTYLKGNLTDHLDKLRDQGLYFIDWWTRTEIEERVKEYPDLIKKYSSILKLK